MSKGTEVMIRFLRIENQSFPSIFIYYFHEFLKIKILSELGTCVVSDPKKMINKQNMLNLFCFLDTEAVGNLNFSGIRCNPE